MADRAHPVDATNDDAALVQQITEALASAPARARLAAIEAACWDMYLDGGTVHVDPDGTVRLDPDGTELAVIYHQQVPPC